MHSPLLRNVKGVSLERINPNSKPKIITIGNLQQKPITLQLQHIKTRSLTHLPAPTQNSLYPRQFFLLMEMGLMTFCLLNTTSNNLVIR